jgi:MFS family permease
LVSVKAIRLGLTPLALGILGSTWGVSYFVSNLALSRFANKQTVNLFMTLGCLLFIAIALGCIFFNALSALLILTFLIGPAAAFFFVGFQLFMGKGTNLSVLKSTAFYTFSWSSGIAVGSLVSGTLANLPPAISTLPIIASSLLVIAGLRLLKKFPPNQSKTEEIALPRIPSGIDRVISPKTEKAYLLLGWLGIANVNIIASGMRFLMPKLVIDLFRLSATVAGTLLFLSLAVTAVFGLALMKFPTWRYNFKAHSRIELLVLAGVSISSVISGLAGVIIMAVVVGIYSAHASYNAIFYSLCQCKSGRNVSVNESLVGIASIAGPLIMGAALQAGIRYFFLVTVLLLAITYLIQAFLVKSAI